MPTIVILGRKRAGEQLEGQLERAGIRTSWIVHQNREQGLENIIMLKRRGYRFDAVVVCLSPNPPDYIPDFMDKVIKTFGPKCRILVTSEIAYSRLPLVEYGCIPCHPELVGQALINELGNRTAAA